MQPISSQETGIYEIRNTHTNRSYIGQTVGFHDRWRKGYINLLPLGKCHNEFLQHDYNKCKALLGHDKFLEFHVLEVMPNSNKVERNIREEWWINEFQSKQRVLYNLRLEPTKDSAVSARNPKEANKRRSEALSDKRLSEEHKKKLSEAKKGKPSLRKGTRWSPEFRAKMLPIRQAQPKTSKPPLLKGLQHPAAKIYEHLTLISPTGELVFKIECLRAFARLHGLHVSNLHNLLKGKVKSCQGWRINQIHGKLVKVEP